VSRNIASERARCRQVALKQGCLSSAESPNKADRKKSFTPSGRNVVSMKRNYPGAVTKSVLNAGPFGRSAIEVPQGNDVDDEGKPKGGTKLSSMSRCDEGAAGLQKQWQPRRIRTPISMAGETLPNVGLRG
jgi:hypothetical protein